MIPLKGKRIIVTGGASGIGRAVALAVARYGATVAVFDRDARGGEVVTEQMRSGGAEARFWSVDISDDRAVDSAVETSTAWMGGLDVLLHVAGIIQGTMADIDDLTSDIWNRVIDVNLSGSFFVARAAARVMKKAGHGVIVLTSSGAGVTGGSASIAYAPSKGGVHGLTMALAMHLGKYGIRVNDVCPGKVDTAMVTAGREEVRRYTGRSPAPPQPDGGGSPFLYEGNLSSPDGVAEIYAFLASDAADYVRGSIFTR